MLRAIHSSIIIVHDMECGIKENSTMDINMLYDIENITQDMIKNNTVDMDISHSSRNVTQEMITTNRTEIYRNITTEIYRNVTEVEDSKSITKHILKNADFIYSQNNYIHLHNSTNTSNIEYTRSLNPNDGDTQTEAMEKEIATSTISFSSYHNTKTNSRITTIIYEYIKNDVTDVTLEIFNSETKDTLLVTPTYSYDITQTKNTYSFNILISCILFLVFMYIFFIIGMYTWWKKHGYRNITSTGIYNIYIYIYIYVLYYIDKINIII